MNGDDPRDKIDQLINKKEEEQKDKEAHEKSIYAQDLEQVRDNLKFANEIQEKPILTDEYDKNIFGKVLNINPYIAQQAWPSSFYFIDKLIRLNTKASLEWQKRYLSKKRHVPMSMIWLLILFFGIAAAIVVVVLLLPKLGI